MKYYVVPFHSVFNEVKEIIEKNKQEFIETFGNIEVDYAYFLSMSTAGKAYVCMMVDDEIEGIAGFVINENATKADIEAENVMIFIEKEKRNKFTKEFLSFCNESMKKIGANKTVFTIKSDPLARLLKMNGFQKEYTTWSLGYE